MDITDLLTLFKADIGVTHCQRDDYFTRLLEAAQQAVEATGINLDPDNTGDVYLVVMYAVYLKERREVGDKGLPDYLRIAIHNRLAKEVMQDV